MTHLPARTLLFAVLALTACASGMDEDQCASADWNAYGYEDGRSGRSLGTLNERAADCRRYGLRVDGEAYRTGLTAGLRAYCTPQTAYELGDRYAAYQGQCSGFGEPEFLDSYDDGVDAYLTRTCTYEGGVALGEAGTRDDGRCAGRPGETRFGEGQADGAELARLRGVVSDARGVISRADHAVRAAERQLGRLETTSPDAGNYAKRYRRWEEADRAAVRAVADADVAQGRLIEAERSLFYLEGRIDGRAGR